jgi:hypothetical protein
VTHGEVFWLFVGFVCGATAVSIGFRILLLPISCASEPSSPADAVRILAGKQVRKQVREPVIYDLDPSNHPDFPGRN